MLPQFDSAESVWVDDPARDHGRTGRLAIVGLPLLLLCDEILDDLFLFLGPLLFLLYLLLMVHVHVLHDATHCLHRRILVRFLSRDAIDAGVEAI